MKTHTDPKVDYAFKHVFGREQSKAALMSLLDAVLQPAPGQSIASLELLNPFNEKAFESAKLSIVDIKARDESGRQFLIEMQMLAADVFRQRALYYWAALYQEQLHQGEDWPALRPTIAVCFVDTPLFPELDDSHLTFELRERRSQALFTNHVALHILELSKFNKEIGELTTPLDRWLYFLRHATELDTDVLPKSLDVAELRWAMGNLMMISQSKQERERYESRLKMQRDVYTALAEKLDEGRAEGRAEHVQFLQKSLRQPVTPLAELRSLSAADLQSLAAQLESELVARLGNGD